MKNLIVTRNSIQEVDMTEEEVSLKVQSDAEFEAKKPLLLLSRELKELDALMPRYIEDIILVMTEEQYEKLPNIQKENLLKKQSVRTQYLESL